MGILSNRGWPFRADARSAWGPRSPVTAVSPRATSTRGRTARTCATRYGWHASISSARARGPRGSSPHGDDRECTCGSASQGPRGPPWARENPALARRTSPLGSLQLGPEDGEVADLRLDLLDLPGVLRADLVVPFLRAVLV